MSRACFLYSFDTLIPEMQIYRGQGGWGPADVSQTEENGLKSFLFFFDFWLSRCVLCIFLLPFLLPFLSRAVRIEMRPEEILPARVDATL